MNLPSPTPTQRIEELRRDLDRLSALVEKHDVVNSVAHKAIEEQVAEMKEAVLRLQEKLIELMKSTTDHEARIRALERGTDRLWQFAPMVISGVGVVIALVALFVKK